MRLGHNRLAARDALRDSSNAIRLTLSAARFIPAVYSNVQADARAALKSNKAQPEACHRKGHEQIGSVLNVTRSSAVCI